MSNAISLEKIQHIVRAIRKDDSIVITETTDMLNEKILDSLDGLIFFMELDTQCGISIPDDVDLAQEGYFSVQKLLTLQG